MVAGETVALLMTDVVASSPKWRDAPEAMDAAMRRHHEIVHGAVEAWGGWRPLDQGEGDAVLAAFRSAPAAVAAAVQAQLELQSEPWPDGAALSVRMGVHAGDVLSRGGNLFGETVNRCARVRGVASGGQIVVSSPVFELVRDRLENALRLVELGEHRLRDLSRPERLYQVVAPGLPEEFPALASLDRAQHNLPIQGSTFVGRERELKELLELLNAERLVTLTGFGGMGKTRLALQAAAELADGTGDGVWFVDLSALTDAERVPGEVAAVLGVRETGKGAAEAVLAHLADRRLLLVLDNVEQVMGCSGFVAQILTSCPGVSLLVTSREPLRLRAEREYVLPSLAVPALGEIWTDDVARLGMYEAVRLLVDRAVAANRTFAITNESAPAVAAIVARLDGHPLAIELAAARLKILSPQMLLDRLDSALTLLTGGGRDHPQRHQTLHATIAWSYDLLPDQEQRLLQRLSVFAGTPTLDAIEQVCGGDAELSVLDGMAALSDKSFLRIDDDPMTGERRFGLLGSIRDFASARLALTGEADEVRDRHADYYCRLGAVRNDWDPAEEERSLALITPDVVELRAALTHLLVGPPERLLEIPWTYFEYLTRAGLLSEAISAGNALLERTEGNHPRRQVVLHQVAWSLEASGRPAQAASVRKKMVAEAEALGSPAELAFALSGLLQHAGRFDTARTLVERLTEVLDELAKTSGHDRYPEVLNHAGAALSNVLKHTDPTAALEYALGVQALAIEHHSRHQIALGAAGVARCRLALGDVAGARAELADVPLGIASPLGTARRAAAIALKGRIAAAAGDSGEARKWALEAIAAAAANADTCTVAEVLLADLDLLDGSHESVLARQAAVAGALSAEAVTAHACLQWRAARAARLCDRPQTARSLLDHALPVLAEHEVLVLPDLLAARLEESELEGEPAGIEQCRAQLHARLKQSQWPLCLLSQPPGAAGHQA